MVEGIGEGPLAPRHPDLRPDPNALQPWAVRGTERAEPEPEPEPLHLPGAPEVLERRAIGLERRAAWVLLLAPPFAIVGGNLYGIVGLLMGLGANLAAIGLAYRNRPAPARNAAGFAAIAYAAGSMVTIFVAPLALLAYLPLGLAVSWLGRARALRREAWRIVWSARHDRDRQQRRDLGR